MAWQALAAAVVGGIAGGQKDKQGGYTESRGTTSVQLQDINQLNVGRSALEESADKFSLSGFNDLTKLLQFGPGQNEVDASTKFQNEFANRLNALFSQGNDPSQQQITDANKYASDIFAPQREQLRQDFADQEINANRLAAKLGRTGTDPILRNKLAQEQTRQSRTLSAQQGAFSAERAGNAQAREGEFLMNVGGSLSNVRQGLATQAFQNRQSLLTMGQQLMTNERNFRLGAANRSTYGYQSNEQWSGGGFKGAMTGAMAGAGSMMGGGGMGGMGGGGMGG